MGTFAVEIREALFQIEGSTASGPDGLPPLFFQRFWSIVGPDVSSVILSFLNFGRILKKINFTHVSLIPKEKKPSEMTHFRPISLCNILYKIASKVLANQLKFIILALFLNIKVPLCREDSSLITPSCLRKLLISYSIKKGVRKVLWQ